MERQDPHARPGNDNAAKREGKESQETCPREKTAEMLAKQFDVSPRTIRNDAKYSENAETLIQAGIAEQKIVEAPRQM